MFMQWWVMSTYKVLSLLSRLVTVDSVVRLLTGNILLTNSLLTLCKSYNGLFARGPKQILKYYFDSLTKELDFLLFKSFFLNLPSKFGIL